MTIGSYLLRQERYRQLTHEHYTPAHDRGHRPGELTLAALAYANYAIKQMQLYWISVGRSSNMPNMWPWEGNWWKPSEDPVRNLVKAGALIAAEIDKYILEHPEKQTVNEAAPGSSSGEANDGKQGGNMFSFLTDIPEVCGVDYKLYPGGVEIEVTVKSPDGFHRLNIFEASPDPDQDARDYDRHGLARAALERAVNVIRGAQSRQEPVNGVCCDCGYFGKDETECPAREDKTHCVHWYDGPYDGPNPESDIRPDGRP